MEGAPFRAPTDPEEGLGELSFQHDAIGMEHISDAALLRAADCSCFVYLPFLVYHPASPGRDQAPHRDHRQADREMMVSSLGIFADYSAM